MASEMSLEFYQISYKDEQIKECYDFCRPYRNETLTDFFENSIISDVAAKSQADFISVCSWRLRKKRQDGWTPMLCGFAGKEDDLSEEKIMKQDFDVAVLTPRTSSHLMLTNARYWHGGLEHNFVWEKAIHELKKILFIPQEVKTAIYENHFIARKEIYHDYIINCLNPVMRYMSDKSIFFSDSGYAKKKERQQSKEVERYRTQTGRLDYPIAPFILERLFSIWIDDRNFKIVNM